MDQTPGSIILRAQASHIVRILARILCFSINLRTIWFQTLVDRQTFWWTEPIPGVNYARWTSSNWVEDWAARREILTQTCHSFSWGRRYIGCLKAQTLRLNNQLLTLLELARKWTADQGKTINLVGCHRHPSSLPVDTLNWTQVTQLTLTLIPIKLSRWTISAAMLQINLWWACERLQVLFFLRKKRVMNFRVSKIFIIPTLNHPWQTVVT